MNYPACVTCGNRMRKSTQLAKDHPGTVAPGGKGACKVCHRRERGRRTVPLVTEQREFHIAVARTALNGYINDRRKRLGATA